MQDAPKCSGLTTSTYNNIDALIRIFLIKAHTYTDLAANAAMHCSLATHKTAYAAESRAAATGSLHDPQAQAT